MAIEESLLYREIKNVISESNKPVFFNFSCKLIANGKEIEPYALVTKDLLRDYANKFTDVLQIKVLIPKGDFAQYILPYEDTLECVLRYQPMSGNSKIEDNANPVQIERYRATLDVKAHPKVKGAAGHDMSYEAMNKNGFQEVSIQLVDGIAYQLRLLQVGGIHSNVNPGELARFLLGKYTEVIPPGTAVPFKGVDLVKPSNTEIWPTIDFLHGIYLEQVPAYLQKYYGGIYSTGIGYYYQKGIWYIYPALDITRFDTVKRSLSIMIVPPRKFPHIEKTYRLDNGNVIVLATGEVKHLDGSELVNLNQGNGARFTDASKMMFNFGTYENGNFNVDRGVNNSEFYSIERSDGVQITPVSDNRITTNAMAEYSRVALAESSLMVVQWQNCNETLLYPGMPVKIHYESDNEDKTILGVLWQAHYFSTGNSYTHVESSHVTHATLMIRVKTTQSPIPTMK